MKKLLILLIPFALLLSSCEFLKTTDLKELAEFEESQNLYFISTDPEECESLRFRCEELFIPFSDASGCGCIKTEMASEPLEPEELVYESKTINEETDQYIIDITYPEFEDADELNKAIDDSVDIEIEFFLDEIEEFGIEPGDEFFLGKYSLYIDYIIYSANSEIASIAFPTSYYQTGAAHPMNYTEILNFDLLTNEEIELVDMFVPDTEYWTAISYSVLPKLKDVLLEDDWSYDEWIEEGAGPEPENFIGFNLTDEGFIFHFDPYQVAPYAAGPQRIEVPFEELYAILLPPWNRE